MTESAAEAWRSEDAWILASLGTGRRGMTLRQLIGAADAYNHAIPTRDELSSALGSLIGAGLAEVTADGYRTTSAGLALRKPWKGGMFTWGKGLLPQLEGLPRASEEWPLSDEDFATAYRDNRRRSRV